MAVQHDEGLCIRQWDWSETSQTAMVFSRSLGMLRVLAKGAKRPKAAYSGGLEMLSRGRIGVIIRPATELALLTEWDVVETYSGLRHRLQTHQAGMYIADVLQHVVRDQDPHPGLYDASIDALRALAAAGASDDGDLLEAVARALVVFQWRVLDESGVRPVLDRDARSAQPLSVREWYVFDPELGGLIAPAGAGAGDEDEGGGGGGEAGMGGPTRTERGWRVRHATVDLLQRVARGEGLSSGAGAEPVGLAVLDRANRLLASYLRFVLGTEPATMRTAFPKGLSR